MTDQSYQEKRNFQQLLSLGQPVNLVLSGGGVKGVAHIALLQLLQDKGIKINSISGSSAGALVGALYSSGNSIADILDFFKNTPIFRYTWLNPIKAGIFDSTKYESILAKHIAPTFADVSTPLIITATNIEKNELVYFDKGSLVKPLLASCAVPAVFTPVDIEDELYADGGVMDNFPVRPFRNVDGPILGSYACPPGIRGKKDLNSILKVTNHTNALLLAAANEYKIKETDSTITFPLGGYGPFDTKKIDVIFQKSQEHLQTLLD